MVTTSNNRKFQCKAAVLRKGTCRRSGWTRMVSLLLLAAVSAVPAWAATYYVDYASGNDANSGLSAAQAWKHAPGDTNASGTARGTSLSAGDTVLFKGGVHYRSTVRVNWDGAAGNPITLKGDGWGSEKAVIDGANPLTGSWTQCASQSAAAGNPNWQNIYYIDAPSGHELFNTIYEDDSFLWFAQSPNVSDPFYYDHIGDYYSIPLGDSSIQLTRTSMKDPRVFTQSDPNYWVGAYISAWVRPNIVEMRRITSYNPSTNTVFFDDIGGDPYNDRDGRYSVLNHVGLIDQPGEYCWDEASNRLYVWPRSGNPANSDWSAGARMMGIYQNGKDHVVIEGFVIQKHYAGLGAHNEGGAIQILSWKDAAVDVVVRNNEIRQHRSLAGAGVINIYNGDNVVVENNQITDNQRNIGVLASGNDVIVRNNYVARCSRLGIWFMGVHNGQIVGNTVYDIQGAHANGMSTYSGCSNVLVARNFVNTLDNMHTFTFRDSSDLTLVSNVFISTSNDTRVSEWANMSGTVAFYNNVILGNAKNTCLNLAVDGSTANYIVKNNILDGGGAGDPRTTHSHNIYTGLRWNQDESDLDPTESVVENLDLLFVNPGANDFRLKEGSPAIDAGTTITYNEDIEGNSRPQGGAFDIGAYESGGGSTQPAVTVSIGAPSVSRTKSGPVTFLVTYTDADSITLAPGDVSLNATGTASATVGVSGSGNTRTVTLSNTTGSGALAISLAAGTASNSAGPAPAAGPSSPIVVDNTPPVLSLVGSATVVVGIGDAFTDPGATATDNVDGNLTGAITVEGSVNTAVVGSYSLVYRVQDQVGNSASPVTRTVNVVDDIPPSITLSGANPLYLSVGQAYSEPGYSATDNVDGNLTGQVVVSGSVNTSVPGSYTRTYSVSDAAGNSTGIARTVVVRDTTAPVLSLSGANPMYIEAGSTFTDPGATATDNVDGNLTGSIQVTGGVNASVPGSYTRTYSVSDAAGNNASTTRTVVVRDTTDPVLSLSGANPMNIEAGSTFTDPGATATDGVDGDLTGSIQVSGSVNAAAPGTYTLTYSVSDAAGNSASATRTVVVADHTAPVVTLVGANPLEIQAGHSYSDPGATAWDNVDGDLTSSIEVSGSVNASTPGTYSVTYSVSDAAGNNASKVRSVVVSAAPVNNAPTLNAPAAVSACENEDICVMMSVSDADGDSVEVMADISGLPEGAVTTLTDEGDGTCHFDWTPAEGMAGTFTVTFTACDDREPPATCSAVTTITVDPAPVVPVVQFASDFASVEEAAGLAQVQLELSVPVPEGQTVEIELAYGEVDAEHGKDFEFLVSGLTAEAGQQTLTFDIPILDDVEVEGNESLDISIVAVVNGEVGSTALMTVQILDDDFGDACDTGYHSADFSQDYDIDLSELLRCVQLYRYGAYHVDSRTEDGYAPGAGSQDGCPHSGDYQGGADWRITLSELLRLIELFSASGGYDVCPDSEDGFCRR